MSDIPREVLAEAEFRQALDNIQAKHGVTILLNKALEEDMPLDIAEFQYWPDRNPKDQRELIDFHGLTINRVALKYYETIFDYQMKQELKNDS